MILKRNTIIGVYIQIKKGSGWRQSLLHQYKLINESTDYRIYTILKNNENKEFIWIIPYFISFVKDMYKSNAIFQHNSYLIYSIPGILMAILFNKKLFLRVSGGELFSIGPLKKRLYQFCTSFLVLNNYQAKISERLGSQYSYIFNPSRFEYSNVTKDDKIKILFIGHFCRRKGIDRLYNIINQKKNNSNFSFKLIGGYEETDKESIELINELKYFNNVEIMPYQNDLKFYFMESSYLLLPSRYEGMPNVFIESFSFNCVPIGFINTPGIKEVIDKTGIPYIDENNYVKQFYNLIENIGKSGYNTRLPYEQYSSNKFSKIMKDVFN